MRRPSRVTAAVLLLTALALLTRFVGLGARPFHWDEARVGYWTLRSLETGVYEYRPVAGGPFLYLVSRVAFDALGTSDAAARAVVALVGGLLPAAALLFHAPRSAGAAGSEPTPEATPGTDSASDADSVSDADTASDADTVAADTVAADTDSFAVAADTPPPTTRVDRTSARSDERAADHGWCVGLDGTETVSLALLLAVSPPLLYYSRFLRGDLPLAAFGLVAFGCLVRARLTGRRRYLYLGAVAVGLALSTSALAVAMLACWLVAATLSFDEIRVERRSAAVVRGRVRSIRSSAAAATTPLARSLFVLLGVVAFLFAPRGGEAGLYSFGTFPAALYRGTFGAFERFAGVFVLGRHNPPAHTNGHALVPYVEGLVATLVVTALPVVALALYGFLRERYSGRSRSAVTFAGYWAGVGVLFFAGATEVNAPWVAVHVLAPLTVPGAVGLAAVVDYARDAITGSDAAPVAVAVLLLFAGGLHVGVVATEAYGSPDADADLAQYGQPGADLRPAVENATTAIEGNEGVDVLYVGSPYAVGDETSLRQPPVPPSDRAVFSSRLPLSWYFERAGAQTASIAQPEGLTGNPPPVVVTSPELRDDVGERLGDGYRVYEVDLALYDRIAVVFVRQ